MSALITDPYEDNVRDYDMPSWRPNVAVVVVKFSDGGGDLVGFGTVIGALEFVNKKRDDLTVVDLYPA